MQITINASKKYNVEIGEGLLSVLGEKIAKVAPKAQKILVVCDEVVAPLYLRQVTESLKKSGYKPFTCILPSGENTKNLENFGLLCSSASVAGLCRTDLFLALGGGVMGDLVGFSASAFMRGINYVQVPTTFLSAIDSSVGGKTAINLPEGKNLVGAFWQPIAVFYDTDTLKTLPKEQILCGLGEAIKYAVLCGGRIYDILKNGFEKDFAELVFLCVQKKAEIVERDETEHGERKLLNLGHTFAHVLEKLSCFTCFHGQAVAKGLILVAKACYNRGELDKQNFDKIENLLTKYGFDLTVSATPSQLVSGAKTDKKAEENGISIIKIKQVGNCFVQNVTFDELGEFANDAFN